MAQTPRANLPNRWAELDPRTIELIARMNEEERRNLVRLMRLSDKEYDRLDKVLKLPDDEFEAGVYAMTSIVRVKWLAQRAMWIVGTAAAVVIAWRQIVQFIKHG